MSSSSFIFILCLIAALLVLSLVYRRRLRHLSRRMRVDLDRLLDQETQIAKRSCEKLLNGIEGSKAIADYALRGPARTEDLHRALSEIAALLAQTLAS